MKSTIDAAGRVVIPKGLRARLGRTGGQTIQIRERDGIIEIEPAATSMTLVDRGGGPVAIPEQELPTLTDEQMRATMERTRRLSSWTPAWSWRVSFSESARESSDLVTRTAHLAVRHSSTLSRSRRPAFRRRVRAPGLGENHLLFQRDPVYAVLANRLYRSGGQPRICRAGSQAASRCTGGKVVPSRMRPWQER
ncbi:MAG: hypothetical protein WEA24_00670 [Gemmatimonadota bacterium]